MIRQRSPEKKLIVYVPARVPSRGHAVELRTEADIHRDLPLNLLPKAQFPNPLPDGFGGILTKPATW